MVVKRTKMRVVVPNNFYSQTPDEGTGQRQTRKPHNDHLLLDDLVGPELVAK